MPRPSLHDGSPRTSLLVCALLAASASLCYFPGMGGPALFDDPLLLGNPRLYEPSACLAGFLSPCDRVTSGLDYAYRPLTELSFALNWKLASPWLPGLRIGNLLLHFVAALLVFRIAQRLGRMALSPSPLFPWAAALWFAVHPLGVQAVTYVYQRATVLEALMAFLALHLFLISRGEAGWPFRMSLVAALLATLSKETAATLPLLVGAVAWILPDAFSPGRRRSWWLFCVFPLLIAVQVLRAQAQRRAVLGIGIFGDLAGRSPSEHLLIELPVLLRYLRLQGFPWPLPFYHAVPDADLLTAALAGLVLLGAAAWILFGPSSHRLLRMAAALLLAPLTLESSVFPIRDAVFTHRCYPCLLGSGLLFAWIVSKLKGPCACALAALTLLLLGGLTARENLLWGRGEPLFSRDLRCGPSLPGSRSCVAWYAEARGALPLAEQGYRAAIRCPGHDAEPCAGLSRTLGSQGRLEEAAKVAESALQSFPDHPLVLEQALRWTGELARRGGDQDRFRAALGRALRSPLVAGEASLPVARALLATGHAPEAEGVVRRALEGCPGAPRLWEALGILLWSRGSLEEAAQAFEKALSLDAGQCSTLYNLGCVRAVKGDLPGAEEALRKALAIDPGYAPAGLKLEAVLQGRVR